MEAPVLHVRTRIKQPLQTALATAQKQSACRLRRCEMFLVVRMHPDPKAASCYDNVYTIAN